VLACPAGAAPELIAANDTGFLCIDEDDMARKVAAVAGLDRSLCRKWVAERFSAESMTDGYEALYEKLAWPRRCPWSSGEGHPALLGQGPSTGSRRPATRERFVPTGQIAL
jgi:hypothetical protein